MIGRAVMPLVIPPGATRPNRSVLAGRPTRRKLPGQHLPARRGRSAAVYGSGGWGFDSLAARIGWHCAVPARRSDVEVPHARSCSCVDDRRRWAAAGICPAGGPGRAHRRAPHRLHRRLPEVVGRQRHGPCQGHPDRACSGTQRRTDHPAPGLRRHGAAGRRLPHVAQTQLSRAAGREELQLTREGQLTDRFTRAVDQLGSKDVAVRVGGVYALGRIADESITDRASIADLLTAYVRRNAPWPPDPKSPFPADFPLDQLPHLSVRAPDIQAILTVLGRRTPSPAYPALWTSLDLSSADLRRSTLVGSNLWRVRFREASLARAWLFKADLRGVDLREADLRDANLREAVADLTTWWPDD